MEDAIAFWRETCRNPVLRPWLRRESTAAAIKLTRLMMSEAVHYDVMFRKMVHSIPKARRLHVLRQVDQATGDNLFHCAVSSGNIDTIKTVFACCTHKSSAYMGVVMAQNQSGRNVLHVAAQAGDHETIEFIFSLLSEESQCLRVETEVE